MLSLLAEFIANIKQDRVLTRVDKNKRQIKIALNYRTRY